jgi:hypothetical protein
MAKALSDKIATLKAQQDAIVAKLNAAQAKAKEEERKRLVRRKTVVGAAILTAIEGDDSLAEIVGLALAMHVTLPADREVIADLLARADATGGKSSKGPKAA